jgi:hypothetical protein
MNQLAIIYLGIAIFALAVAIVSLPTLVHGPKPSRSRSR